MFLLNKIKTSVDQNTWWKSLDTVFCQNYRVALLFTLPNYFMNIDNEFESYKTILK